MTTPAARILSNVSVIAPTAFIVKVEEYKLDIVTRDVYCVNGEGRLDDREDKAEFEKRGKINYANEC